MTVTSTALRIQYDGNGSLTTFAIPFTFKQDADIRVLLTDETTLVETVQVAPTNYSVSGTDVVFVTAPTSNDKVTILSSAEYTQIADYVENDPFPALTHEDALDRQTILIKQVLELINRAWQFNEGTLETLPVNIPDLVASSALVTDASKNLSWSAFSTIVGEVTVSSAMEPVVEALTLALARAAMGVQEDLDVVSQVEAEAGTATDERIWTAERVKQAIVALGSTTIGKQTLWVPAGAMRPTVSNGCTFVGSVETTAGRPDMTALNFSDTVDEHAQFSVAFPSLWDEGTVTAQFFWTHDGGQTGGQDGVRFFIQGVAISDDDTIDVAYGTAVGMVAKDGAPAEDLYSSAETAAITIAGTPTAGDVCMFRVYRDVSDAGDDLDIDARLLGVRLFYTTEAGVDA